MIATMIRVLLAVGRIQNAWSYVWPAYLITWVGLSLYVLSLVIRLKRGTRDREKKERP